jgi:hypothetical protein
MGDAPDRSVAVFTDKHRTISRRRDANRAPPDLLVGDHKAGHEVFVFAGRVASAVEQHADDLVTRPPRAVPGAMQCHECPALVRGREVLALIKDDLKGGGVGLDQHVGNSDLVLQVGTLALLARVLVRPEVVPGPAIECAFLDLRCVLERSVFAEFVALVDDAPRTAVAG